MRLREASWLFSDMLGIKNIGILQRLQHYSVMMEMWRQCLYKDWHSSPLNTRAMLWAGHCLPHNCMAVNKSTELWHFKKIGKSLVWMCFGDKPALKLNQNVKNMKGASRSAAFFCFVVDKMWWGGSVRFSVARDFLSKSGPTRAHLLYNWGKRRIS